MKAAELRKDAFCASLKAVGAVKEYVSLEGDVLRVGDVIGVTTSPSMPLVMW
jgi:hypothetical protein